MNAGGAGKSFRKYQSRGKRLTEVIAPAHTFDAALGVNDPLFSSVEGMALAANFDSHSGLGPACVEHVAAGAGYCRFDEFGVDICFHYCCRFIRWTPPGKRSLGACLWRPTRILLVRRSWCTG